MTLLERCVLTVDETVSLKTETICVRESFKLEPMINRSLKSKFTPEREDVFTQPLRLNIL